MKRYRWLAPVGVVALLAVGIVLIIWRGPDWHTVHHSFTRGLVAVGRRCHRAQPPVGRRPRGRLGHGDRAVRRSTEAALPARLLGVLRRALRQRRAARPRRRVRALRCAAPAHAGAEGHDRDADRLGVRASDVRSLPDARARRLGALHGEDPAQRLHADRRRARAGDPLVHRRSVPRAPSAPRARLARPHLAARSPVRAWVSPSCGGRSRR